MIARALTGTWKQEQIFVLQQALALYDAYTSQLVVCDARIEQYLQAMESRGTPNAALPDLSPSKHDKKAKNEASFNARAQYARIVGSIWSPCSACRLAMSRGLSPKSARI
jgi:hypothetical protein